MLGQKKGFYNILCMQYQKWAQNRPHPLMTNTSFIFKNKNLLKNLSSLIFQLAPFLKEPS